MTVLGVDEQDTLERALEARFPWASDAQIREVTQLVGERLRSRNFSKGFTAELREDAQEMGELIARIVGPAPATPGRVRRILSSLSNRLPKRRRRTWVVWPSVRHERALQASYYNIKRPEREYKSPPKILLLAKRRARALRLRLIRIRRNDDTIR
ncbi:hypothetical protein [Mycobacteroides abscessus]|uniref:hypothetical protein n=1 Tax=Mycobacteroides abscessus TaxID=36809 RepID=UPI001877550A